MDMNLITTILETVGSRSKKSHLVRTFLLHYNMIEEQTKMYKTEKFWQMYLFMSDPHTLENKLTPVVIAIIQS